VTTWRPSRLSPAEIEPRRLSDSLDRVTARLGGPPANVLATVFTRWEDLVGADIAAHARPHSLRDGVLVMVVDQPAWAGQLRYMTTDILRRLGAATGTSAVSEIRIRVAGARSPKGPDERPS
jgi:predicted nucleic acid-binding Zn ribbon protein